MLGFFKFQGNLSSRRASTRFSKWFCSKQKVI